MISESRVSVFFAAERIPLKSEIAILQRTNCVRNNTNHLLENVQERICE